MMAEQKEKKKGSRVALAACIVVIVILLAAVFVLWSQKKDKKETVDRTVSEGLVVDGNIDRKASDARFTTDMNMIWTFPSGSAVSDNAIVGNSESNEYECYFEVYLDNEEQTLLYSSPVIPVGKRLDELKLNQVLPDGSYDAICTYHILDDEDPERELGTVSFAVSLMVVR